MGKHSMKTLKIDEKEKRLYKEMLFLNQVALEKLEILEDFHDRNLEVIDPRR